MRNHHARNKAAALARVMADNRKQLLKTADEMLVEYILAGGPLCGSEYGKQLMEAAFEGRDLSRLLKSLVAWLDKEDEKRERGSQ